MQEGPEVAMSPKATARKGQAKERPSTRVGKHIRYAGAVLRRKDHRVDALGFLILVKERDL